MKTIEVKCLLDNIKIAEENKMEITGFEQNYEFKIGKKGYLYESSLERDADGNIISVQDCGALTQPRQDVETWIASLCNKDSAEWYYLDQKVFDADVNEELTHCVNSKEFIENNQIIDEEELKFIKENTDGDGYMKVYVTITNNTIVGEEI